ncbi:MAG: SAM-dependent methyltransferase [Deltaproteobacteria bacterium]|nr:SAM-dependent methyltransferase [Deltaproteobacteria bacterium]
MRSVSRNAPDPRADPDVPPGMSIDLLKELHLLTRDGQLNADARRKLKQIRHFVGLLRPALEDALARHASPTVVDCGAGKSYLGFLLYELVLGPANRGTLLAVESRPELVDAAVARAARYRQDRLRFVGGTIADADLPERIHVVTALHACDTATDDALALGIARGADSIAVVPCCQAEVARQLSGPGDHDDDRGRDRDPADQALIQHALHRREMGSHLTNVVRALCLTAHGYRVTVTELVGWEHSAKNELLLGQRVHRFERESRTTLARLLDRWRVEPVLVRLLRARGLDPCAPVGNVSSP